MGDSKAISEMPEWRHFLGLGILFVSQLWFDIAPAGPWESRSFSRGVIGLIGLGLIYLAWFRITFRRSDRIIPTLEMWKSPHTSLRIVATVGLIFVCLSWLSGNVFSEYVPGPTSLLLNLFGMMMLLQTFYVWMVLNGPLQDQNSESE